MSKTSNVADLPARDADAVLPIAADIVKPVAPVPPVDTTAALDSKAKQQAQEMATAERFAKETQELGISGETDDIAINLLYRANNVRTPATLQLPAMVTSILRNGFKKNHPLVVSKKRDGRFLVLCGNRRMEGIETIMANYPDKVETLFPSGSIPCVVHENLTEEQEAILRVDHGPDEDRVPLDEFGEFLAIKQLMHAGYDTQTGIAEKMGWYKVSKKTGIKEPNRSKVQQRCNLVQLPQFVQDEMQRYLEEPSQSNLRWSMIQNLTTIYNKEYREFPNGNGPLFQEAWQKALAGPTVTGTGVPIKPITPADAEKRSKLVGSRNLRDALMTFAGVGQATLSDIDGAIVRAEAAEATLSEIADYLGENDFAELVTEARNAAVAKAAEIKAAPVFAG